MSKQQPPPKLSRPVESFGPELLAALLKGATEEFFVPMTWRQAIRFRQRVHSMRTVMRETGHPKFALCSKVSIGIELPPGTQTVKSGRHSVPIDKGVQVQLRLYPNDSEFGPLRAAAGVQTEAEIEAATKTVLPNSNTPGLDPLDSMFGELKKDPGR